MSLTIDNFDPVVTPSDREALRRGYVFDKARADRPVRFIERLIVQSVGPFEGEPLRLLDWQKSALWRSFGWIDPKTGYRRHRELFIEVPKKQGKGEMASALALYMLMADGEAAPKIALAACDRKQAAQTYDAIERMVKRLIRRHPDLCKGLDYSDFYKRIRNKENDGIIETNSSDADSPDGGNLSCVITDELHRWTGSRRKAWNVYLGSGAARTQPLKIIISTSGDDRQSIMYELHQRALKIESGELIDLGFCGVVYGPREGEEYDPHDEETWFRYNPSLGHTMTLEGFRADYEAAKSSPESWQYWLRTRLGVWTQEAARFIDADLWAACPPRRLAQEIPLGSPVHAGLDLSSTRDITALVKIIGDIETGVDVHLKAWIPEEEAERREKVNGIPFRRWAEEGYITLTRGSRIDYDAVQADIEADHALTPYQSLMGDHYNAQLVGSRLLAAGVPFVVIRQGLLSLNSPTKLLEKLIAEGKIRHGNNPLLTWCASNCVAVRDKNDNVMLDKAKSHEKIDPVAALVNAVAGLIDSTINNITNAPLTEVKFLWKAHA